MYRYVHMYKETAGVKKKREIGRYKERQRDKGS